MVEMDTLAGKVFSLLKGNGFKIKIFDVDGAEVTDPSIGRRFFVVSPNIMVTIDEDSNSVEFSKGAGIDDEVVNKVQKNVRKLADEFLMNSNIKVFGKTIQPKDYAYQAKMQKEPAMMESKSTNPGSIEDDAFEFFENCLGRGHKFSEAVQYTVLSMKKLYNLDSTSTALLRDKILNNYKEQSAAPNEDNAMNEGFQTNSLMLSKVYHELDYAAGMTAQALADAIPGADLNDVQKALNALLNDNKVEVISHMGKHPVYGKSMEEAIMEVSTEKLASYKAAAGKDASAADKAGDTKRADKRFSGIVKATNKQFANDAKPKTESIQEGLSKMFGSRKTSQQTLENVRILARHKTPVDENVRGARTRQISAIFLECNGERFRLPSTYLPGARAMAQHMAHGGTMFDKVGMYINESVDQLLKLQSFNRYVTTNKLINEDSSGIVETVKENIETLRTELKKLTGTKTYETVKARIETFEREQLSEDDTSQLKDLFTIRRFDEKFEEVLPIVKQLVQEKDTYHKRIEEAAGNVVLLRCETINTTPMFEFASENARLGFKINELALRILENDELAKFVNKIGTKMCKEGEVNPFERAVLTQVLENVQIEKQSEIAKKEIKESSSLDAFYDKYTMSFF